MLLPRPRTFHLNCHCVWILDDFTSIVVVVFPPLFSRGSVIGIVTGPLGCVVVFFSLSGQLEVVVSPAHLSFMVYATLAALNRPRLIRLMSAVHPPQLTFSPLLACLRVRVSVYCFPASASAGTWGPNSSSPSPSVSNRLHLHAHLHILPAYEQYHKHKWLRH